MIVSRRIIYIVVYGFLDFVLLTISNAAFSVQTILSARFKFIYSSCTTCDAGNNLKAPRV